MNIIINGFSNQALSKVIDEILNKIQIENFFLINDKKNNYQFPNINKNWISLFSQDLYNGHYPFDSYAIPPLEESIITQMSQCETVILKMMDRNRPHQGILDYEERKNLYLKHLQFWNWVIHEKKIELFISANIPHESYDYIIYELCKIKKIPTFIFFQSQIPDCCFLVQDWKKSIEEVAPLYEQLKISYKNSTEEEIKIQENFENHFNSFFHPERNPIPFYMKKEKFFIKIKKIIIKRVFQIKNLKRHKISSYFKYPFRIFKNMLKNLKLNLFYSYHSRFFNAKKTNIEYIYYPLHFQPEMTSCTLGGAYVDQLLLAKLLRFGINKNCALYIKEHPKQKWLGRHHSFYKELQSLPDTFLVPKKISSFELFKNALAVATISGTAGWEALFKGKPVLLFGNYFYQYAPGVFPVKSLEDLKNAIEKISSRKTGLSPINLKIFLKALEQIHIHGYCDPAYEKISKNSREENCSNITQAILKKIEKIFPEIYKGTNP